MIKRNISRKLIHRAINKVSVVPPLPNTSTTIPANCGVYTSLQIQTGKFLLAGFGDRDQSLIRLFVWGSNIYWRPFEEKDLY
ncbi:LOW QUALITY PROTEIN: hypothetical protein HZS_2438 [Henneguya salminicola]|nr:LOW QUALITY PROTEIN: hypothetical protein HZS_2438 [Henneguya salminicola]